MAKKRIALIAGGWSGEREISIKSGQAVLKAFDRNKYDVEWYDPRDDLDKLIEKKRRIDLAFILLHGKFGEDGRIQGLLDILDVPYVGSGVLASAVALNKRMTKALYKSNGLQVAKDMVLRRSDGFFVRKITERLGPVTIVKPVTEGSSLGISRCKNEDELKIGINKAFQHEDEIMVEEYIDGREVTCCVLGNQRLQALPLVEIIPNKEFPFFDYRAKYTPGATREICPAQLSKSLTEKAQACGMEAHRVLECRVWSRTDMIIRNETIYLLETNTIPGMTETSLFPLAAKMAGITFPRLLDRLILLSLEKEGL
jgi:D-alanine-D-alanine ligase